MRPDANPPKLIELTCVVLPETEGDVMVKVKVSLE